MGKATVGDTTLWRVIVALGLCGDAPTMLILVEIGDPVLLTVTGGLGLCLNTGAGGTCLEGDTPLLILGTCLIALVPRFYGFFLKR